MAGIDFNMTKVLQQAKQLDEIADDLTSKTGKRFSESIGQIEAAWSGEAATVYLQYCRQQHEDLLKKGRHLRLIAEALRDAAQRMQAAEQQVQQLSQ